MYKRIEISGFRGIRHAVLDNLGMINILVGRNNAGKSSCLEATSLLAAGQSLFKDALGEDALKQATLGTTHVETGWSHIIRAGSASASITAQRDDGGERPDRLVIADTFRELAECSTDLQGSVAFAVRDRLKGSPTDHDLLFHFKGDAEVLGELYMAGGRVCSDVRGNSRGEASHRSTKSLLMADRWHMAEKLHDKLAKIGAIGDVTAQIREAMPDVRDIRVVGGSLHLHTKNGKSQPLEIMGDGIKMSIIIAMATHVAKGGTVVIEELENYMHPGLMLWVVDWMVSGCAKNKTQFVISTHSIDFVRYVLDRAPPDLKVSVFRLSKLDEDTGVEHYDRDSANECVNELGMDLRGM